MDEGDMDEGDMGEGGTQGAGADQGVHRAVLEAEHERLVGLRRSVGGDVLDEIGSLGSELSAADQHPAESGTGSIEDRERDQSLLEQLDQQLRDVDDAIMRLDRGEYGLCEVCGELIGEAQLEALPATRFCLLHQELAEREVGPRVCPVVPPTPCPRSDPDVPHPLRPDGPRSLRPTVLSSDRASPDLRSRGLTMAGLVNVPSRSCGRYPMTSDRAQSTAPPSSPVHPRESGTAVPRSTRCRVRRCRRRLRSPAVGWVTRDAPARRGSGFRRPALAALCGLVVLATLVVPTAEAGADASTSLTETATPTVLYGTPSTVGLTAANTTGTAQFNATFTDVLPVGVAYVPGLELVGWTALRRPDRLRRPACERPDDPGLAQRGRPPAGVDAGPVVQTAGPDRIRARPTRSDPPGRQLHRRDRRLRQQRPPDGPDLRRHGVGGPRDLHRQRRRVRHDGRVPHRGGPRPALAPG